MTQFRMDNTEGYTQRQLDELNRRYDKRIATYAAGPEGRIRTSSDPHFFTEKCVADYVAEQVLFEFDTDGDDR